MTLRDVRSAHEAYRGAAGAASLAKAVGGLCSPSTIRRWESGHPIPERAEDRLCALLGLAGQQRMRVLSATRDLQHARSAGRVGRIAFPWRGMGSGTAGGSSQTRQDGAI